MSALGKIKKYGPSLFFAFTVSECCGGVTYEVTDDIYFAGSIFALFMVAGIWAAIKDGRESV